jgi:hypothetical protein
MSELIELTKTELDEVTGGIGPVIPVITLPNITTQTQVGVNVANVAGLLGGSQNVAQVVEQVMSNGPMLP